MKKLNKVGVLIDSVVLFGCVLIMIQGLLKGDVKTEWIILSYVVGNSLQLKMRSDT